MAGVGCGEVVLSNRVGCGEVVLSNRVLGVKVCGGGCDLITSRMLSDWCYAKSCKAMDEGGVLGDRLWVCRGSNQ